MTQTKLSYHKAIFRWIVYSLFVIIMLKLDNGFSFVDTKNISIFVLFSLIFELAYIPTRQQCRKIISSVIIFCMAVSGLFLVNHASCIEKQKSCLTAKQ